MSSIILVIDDNPEAAELLAEVLRMEGRTAITAYDGANGIVEAHVHRPYAAIVDILMHGIDGYEVARRLRRSFGQDIFLIALSGQNQREAKQECIKAGFDHYLQKPANIPELYSVLRRANRGS